jgi:hypothetical protein
LEIRVTGAGEPLAFQCLLDVGLGRREILHFEGRAKVLRLVVR